MIIRLAIEKDLSRLVELTRERRNQLERWEPRFWRKRSGIDDLHPHFLRYCVTDPTINVWVVDDDGRVEACAFVHPAAVHHRFIDDLCSEAPEHAALLLDRFRSSPSMVCVPSKDEALLGVVASNGGRLQASYRSVWLEERFRDGVLAEPLRILLGAVVRRPTLPDIPLHSFQRQTIVRLIEHGDAFVRGSDPISTPAYDPGGATTVIDQVCGPDRPELLIDALIMSANRGDVHAIVVCQPSDAELTDTLDALGADRPVQVWSLGR